MSRLYAHRGAAVEEPENTLPSFSMAAAYGVDGLEMDAHMTSDGQVVIAHDSDGKRMCNREASIRHVPFSELSQWDAGWGYVDKGGQRPFAGKGYRIPRFVEILDAFPDLILNVDLKQKSPSMVEKVLKIVTQAGATDRVILASFSQMTLLDIRAKGYLGLTALAPADLIAALTLPNVIAARLPLRGQVAQIPVRHGPISLACPKKISKLQSLGMRVDFWTVNDPDEARRLLSMGADGIMTDDPRRLVGLFLQNYAKL